MRDYMDQADEALWANNNESEESGGKRRCGKTSVMLFDNIDYAFKNDKSRTLVKTLDFKRAVFLARQMMWLMNLHEIEFTFIQGKLEFTLANKSTIRIMSSQQSTAGMRFNKQECVE
jgi:hypothetical protein